MNRPVRDTVSTEAFTTTTHYVQVNLADVLGKYDVTEHVVLVLTMPSGRSKRVTVPSSFLAPTHDEPRGGPLG